MRVSGQVVEGYPINDKKEQMKREFNFYRCQWILVGQRCYEYFKYQKRFNASIIYHRIQPSDAGPKESD